MSSVRRLSALLVAVLVVLAAQGIAVAQDTDAPDPLQLECDVVLTDSGESLGDATPVVVEAAALEEFGTVKIRVFDQTPNGDLDAALAELAGSCGWLDVDGNFLPDVLVFGVSLGDRATRVLYGSEWAPALDDSASVIIDRVVNSQFAEGNFQGGLIGGVQQFASLRADAELRPDVSEIPAGAAGETDGEASPEDSQSATPETETSAGTEASATTEVVSSQGSKTGTYVLIAAVLAAVVVLPALILKRTAKNEPEESGS